MRILVSNDDGYGAEGIPSLVHELRQFAEVTVIVPEQNCSGISHALTMHHALRVNQVDDHTYTVNGYPADCVHLALGHFLKEKPDLVVSGINRGPNLGMDVHYSGTVAVAVEAMLHGLPAMAVSLALPWREDKNANYLPAAKAAASVAKRIVEHGIPEDTFINVNVPNLPTDATMPELKVTRLGRQYYLNDVHPREDPRGNAYYWIGFGWEDAEQPEDSDIAVVRKGHVSVTSVSCKQTLQANMDNMKDWGL